MGFESSLQAHLDNLPRANDQELPQYFESSLEPGRRMQTWQNKRTGIDSVVKRKG